MVLEAGKSKVVALASVEDLLARSSCDRRQKNVSARVNLS